MERLRSKIDAKSSEFKETDRVNRALLAELNERVAKVKEGGGGKYLAEEYEKENASE